MEEHGLNVDGTAKDENSHSIVDGKHVFFNQVTGGCTVMIRY